MNRLLGLVLLLSFSAQAAVEPAAVPAVPAAQPKAFQAWKDLQVLEAQNQLLRVGARISQIRSGRTAKLDTKEPSPLPGGRLKSAGEDPMALAEKDMRRARESLEAANALDLSDYVNIYLPTLESQPDAIDNLTQRLTKEELAEILKLLLLKNNRIDTKRNPPVIGGLSIGPRTNN